MLIILNLILYKNLLKDIKDTCLFETSLSLHESGLDERVWRMSRIVERILLIVSQLSFMSGFQPIRAGYS